MHLPRDCECVYADRHSAPRGHYAVAPPTSIRRHVRDRLDHLAQPLAPSAGGDLALAAAQAAAPLAPRERGPQLPWLLGLTAPPQQAAQVPLPKSDFRTSKMIDGVVWDGKDPKKYAGSFKIKVA